MKIFLEVSISANEAQREILIPSLVELGCQGFEETENSLLCYFDKGRWSLEAYSFFRRDLKKILEQFSVNADIRYREIEEKNWNAEWEKSCTPVQVGRRFTIQPTWFHRANDKERIRIFIDPKMSFGTGFHESTRLALTLMESHMDPGVTMLDVGTGTGILAIAGIALGAVLATGTDIDEWALENARENTRLNNVESKVTIADTALPAFQDGSFGMICANIMYTTIVEMLPDFFRILKPGGKLYLSGLLDSQRKDIVEKLNSYSFALLAETHENEWIALAVQKK